MKTINQAILLSLAIIIASCQDGKDDSVNPHATGKLKLSVSAITVQSSSTNGRTKTVSTDDFIVRIYAVEGDALIEEFNPWSSAPEFIVLETGEYYVEAVSLATPEPAAFDQPWY